MTIFLRELERFLDKYSVQPDPQDEEASSAYWLEVDKAMVSWYNKYRDKEHSEGYHKLIIAAFDFLEELFKERAE